MLEYVLFGSVVLLALISIVVLGKVEEGMMERAYVSLWFGGDMSISRYERGLMFGSIVIGVVAGVLLPLTLFGTVVTSDEVLRFSGVSILFSFVIGLSFMRPPPSWIRDPFHFSNDIEVRRVVGERGSW